MPASGAGSAACAACCHEHGQLGAANMQAYRARYVDMCIMFIMCDVCVCCILTEHTHTTIRGQSSDQEDIGRCHVKPPQHTAGADWVS